MNLGKPVVNKWKKAIFGAVVGIIIGAAFAVPLYLLSEQGLYLAIIGLSMGLGFSIGGGTTDDQQF